MSEKPGSTLGYERRFNKLLRIDDEDRFVSELTAELAPQPPNFKRIVKLNRGEFLTDAASLEPLTPRRVHELLQGDTTLIDGRAPREYDATHVPRSLNVTMINAAVGTRAAWVVEPESQVVVMAANDADAIRLARMLEAVGFRNITGYLAGGIAAWEGADQTIDTTRAIDVAALADLLRKDDGVLLDVREEDEWKKGHVAGSIHVPYHELRDGPPAELEIEGKPVAVACSAGNRSSLAVSLLRRAGVDGLIHVANGGVSDLPDHGVKLVKEEE